MITPIIMESDLDLVREKVATLRSRGESRVHIDIGDGLFSELITISPADLQEISMQKLKIDFHLMVDDVTEYIEECVALSPNRIIGQIERMGSQERFLESVAAYGVDGGLALTLNTPIEAIEKPALKATSTVLLLAVPTGTSGSIFEMRTLTKLKELRSIYKGPIIIDGGINPTTYRLVIDAGASEVGVNSSYWKGEFAYGQS